jgi:hypothetical protein
MWSIHPDQIRPIIRPFARHRGGRTGGTDPAEGAAVQWGPIQHLGNLHDRASYRYYWSILQRATPPAWPAAGGLVRRRRLPLNHAVKTDPISPWHLTLIALLGALFATAGIAQRSRHRRQARRQEEGGQESAGQEGRRCGRCAGCQDALRTPRMMTANPNWAAPCRPTSSAKWATS